MRYTRNQRLHHHPAPSIAPPPHIHKTSPPQLRRHAFRPHPALRDGSPAHSGPNTPYAAIAGPCTATARPYAHPAHPCISHPPDSCPGHRYFLLEISSIIPSSPACIPSLRHTCIIVAPHQQHHATHTIPSLPDSTFPCRSDEQVPPPVCIPPPECDRVASPTVRRHFSVRSQAPCLSLVIQVQSFSFIV
jgi:hypothetical protein